MNKKEKKEKLKKKIQKLIPELLDIEETPDVLKAKGEEKPPKKRRRYILICIIGVFLATLFLRIGTTVKGKAKVVPYKEIIVEARESGILKELYFDEGDKVKKGKLIGKIYNPEYITELKQAKNEIDIINKTQIQLEQRMRWLKTLIKRNEALYRDKVIALAEMETTQLDYDYARLEYEKNKKRVANLKAKITFLEKALENTNIIAPITGVIIGKVSDKIGTYMEKGDELCKIADLSKIYLEFPVYERKIRLIKPGQNVDIIFSAFPEHRVKGKVIGSYPAIWEKVEKVWVKENIMNIKISVDNTPFELKPGMTAYVKVHIGRETLGSFILNKIGSFVFFVINYIVED